MNLAASQLALDAIKKNVFQVPGRLSGATGANPLSRDFLKENIALLDSILVLEPDSIDLQIEKSANQARIGLLWRQRGEPTESVTAYEGALAIAQRVSERRPDEIRPRGALARRHRDLGAAPPTTGVARSAAPLSSSR